MASIFSLFLVLIKLHVAGLPLLLLIPLYFFSEVFEIQFVYHKLLFH